MTILLDYISKKKLISFNFTISEGTYQEYDPRMIHKQHVHNKSFNYQLLFLDFHQSESTTFFEKGP